MTEEESANSGVEVENTDNTETATEATDAGVTDVEVETENDSAKEDEGTANNEVENLRKELEAISGKLKTIRETADKNAELVKNIAPKNEALASENLRLKAAIEHGLDKDALEYLTATDEAGIATQIERIKARDAKIAAGNSSKYVTLAGDNSNPTATPDALERSIEAQLAKINQKGF